MSFSRTSSWLRVFTRMTSAVQTWFLEACDLKIPRKSITRGNSVSNVAGHKTQ